MYKIYNIGPHVHVHRWVQFSIVSKYAELKLRKRVKDHKVGVGREMNCVRRVFPLVVRGVLVTSMH